MRRKIPQPFADDLADSLRTTCDQVRAIKEGGAAGPWSELSILLNTVHRALLWRNEGTIVELAAVAKGLDKRQGRQLLLPGNPAGPWVLAHLQPNTLDRSEKLEALAGFVDTMAPYQGVKLALNELPFLLPEEFKTISEERVELFARQVLPGAEARREEGRDWLSKYAAGAKLSASQERRLGAVVERAFEQFPGPPVPRLRNNADGKDFVRYAARLLGALEPVVSGLFGADRAKRARAKRARASRS